MQTQRLEYEAYTPMASRLLAELEAEARRRWPLEGCAVVHRLGDVPTGEVSVVVAADSPHRGPAFEAVEWLIDQIKQVVPIWKQEHWADGAAGRVHPATEET